MMQLFQLKKVLLTSSLLAASTAGFVDWGDDVPSVEALEQAQRELEQSQREQFSGETCTLSNGNIINARKFTHCLVFYLNIGVFSRCCNFHMSLSNIDISVPSSDIFFWIFIQKLLCYLISINIVNFIIVCFMKTCITNTALDISM